MIKAFDTHLHLDAFDDPERVLNEARAAGIDNWVVPGVSPDGWARIDALAGGCSGVYSAPGIHPMSADRFRPEIAAELRNLLAHPRAVAVGEVGLDRQVDVPWPVQEQVFAAMIRLAREMDKQGAGEIVIQSIEQDGMMQGYDIHLIKSISEAVAIPVVALGGAGNLDHMRKTFIEGYATGLAAGSMFVYHGARNGILVNYPDNSEILNLFN
mgnify:CR=1 FL=1